MTHPLFIVVFYVIKKIVEANSSYSSGGPVAIKPEIVVRKNVCLIGSASSGKSSVGNALLGNEAFTTGVGHGTTTSSQRVAFESNYHLVDTPGLLDAPNYDDVVRHEARRSKIIVYVSTGQLFQKELDFVRGLHRDMSYDQRLLLFVNKQDIKEYTLSSSQRQAERQAVIRQVEDFIPIENIAFGSASPVYRRQQLPTKIDELKLLINKIL